MKCEKGYTASPIDKAATFFFVYLMMEYRCREESDT